MATRLLSSLTARSFARPEGELVQLPAALGAGGDALSTGNFLGVGGADGIYRLVNFETGKVEQQIKLRPDEPWVY